MNATRDYYADCIKSEGKRQIPYDIIYMWNLKHDTNKLIYKTERFVDMKKRLVAV